MNALEKYFLESNIITNKQAEEILESLVKKGYIEKIQGCYRMPEN